METVEQSKIRTIVLTMKLWNAYMTMSNYQQIIQSQVANEAETSNVILPQTEGEIYANMLAWKQNRSVICLIITAILYACYSVIQNETKCFCCHKK